MGDSHIQKHSYFNLTSLGVPTTNWEEYDDESQIVLDKYYVGLMGDNHLEGKTLVEGKESILSHIKELKRQNGKKATVVLEEVEAVLCSSKLLIKPEGIVVSGLPANTDIQEMTSWAQKLTQDFLFDRNILVSWLKTVDGRLLVTDVDHTLKSA